MKYILSLIITCLLFSFSIAAEVKFNYYITNPYLLQKAALNNTFNVLPKNYSGLTFGNWSYNQISEIHRFLNSSSGRFYKNEVGHRSNLEVQLFDAPLPFWEKIDTVCQNIDQFLKSIEVQGYIYFVMDQNWNESFKRVYLVWTERFFQACGKKFKNWSFTLDDYKQFSKYVPNFESTNQKYIRSFTTFKVLNDYIDKKQFLESIKCDGLTRQLYVNPTHESYIDPYVLQRKIKNDNCTYIFELREVSDDRFSLNYMKAVTQN